MTAPGTRYAVVDRASRRAVRVLDLASVNGHHVPGTPTKYRHGWVPVATNATTKLAGLTSSDRRRGNEILDHFTPHRFPNDAAAARYLTDHKPKLPRRVADAVNRYTGDAFFRLNQRLRAGDDSDPDVKLLDKAMQPAPDDLIITRKVNADAFGLADKDLSKVEGLVGKKITDLAYQSAAVGSPYGFGIGGVTMHIAVPKGTPMVNVAALSNNPHEREVLLGRGQQLAIAKVTKNNRGGYDVHAIALPSGGATDLAATGRTSTGGHVTTALLTPYARGHAVELGADSGGRKLYRKQLLKFGPITVDGRRIQFDADYARDVIRSFKNRVIDSVPFQLADAKNTHTNDAERTRGLVKGLELSPTGDGLDMLVELSPDGAKVVDEYPELAVSARIYDGVTYADGRAGTRVLQHVLGTWEPHLGGMRPWEAIALAASDTDTTVVDLTAATYDIEKEPAMADTLTTEEIEGIRALLAKKDDTKTEGGDGQLSDAEAEAELKRLGITDDELQKLLADDDQDSDGDDTGEGDTGEGDTGDEDEPAADAADDKQPVAAALASTQQALELAHAQGEQNTLELARVTDLLDEQTYERERDQLARDCGIPPHVIDLAKPLLKGTGRTIELANGENVDAGAIVRQVFGEWGKLVKVLDLGGEIGHSIDLSRSEEERKAEEDRTEWVKKVRSGSYGL